MTNSGIGAIEEKLSEGLLPVYKLELSLGNVVARIDCPAGTKCPYAVILKNKINHKAIKEQLELHSSISKWENRDRHYPLESGYSCEKTRHAISGPM
jgi:hypothetical protein